MGFLALSNVDLSQVDQHLYIYTTVRHMDLLTWILHIYVDFMKAFGTVPHKRLIVKNVTHKHARDNGKGLRRKRSNIRNTSRLSPRTYTPFYIHKQSPGFS